MLMTRDATTSTGRTLQVDVPSCRALIHLPPFFNTGGGNCYSTDLGSMPRSSNLDTVSRVNDVTAAEIRKRSVGYQKGCHVMLTILKQYVKIVLPDCGLFIWQYLFAYKVYTGSLFVPRFIWHQ